MGKNIKFGNIEIKKQKIHRTKSPISIHITYFNTYYIYIF